MEAEIRRFMRALGRAFKEDVRPGRADPAAFFAELARAWPDRYGELDRYRDFRRVFMETPEGKRVLNTLFQWGLLHENSYRAGQERDETLVREGRRSLALRLLEMLNAEPGAVPGVETTNDDEE